jgi:hypothetical protein
MKATGIQDCRGSLQRHTDPTVEYTFHLFRIVSRRRYRKLSDAFYVSVLCAWICIISETILSISFFRRTNCLVLCTCCPIISDHLRSISSIEVSLALANFLRQWIPLRFPTCRLVHVHCSCCPKHYFLFSLENVRSIPFAERRSSIVRLSHDLRFPYVG